MRASEREREMISKSVILFTDEYACVPACIRIRVRARVYAAMCVIGIIRRFDANIDDVITYTHTNIHSTVPLSFLSSSHSLSLSLLYKANGTSFDVFHVTTWFNGAAMENT